MELGLITTNNGLQVTPQGALYGEKLADTLHRVTKYRMTLLDGSQRTLTYKEYMVFGDRLSDESVRFLKLHDGEIIAVGQIRSIKPYEVIVDTRKENL